MQLRGLLRAVRDAPNDVAPLLAHATWLEGQADPLAELVRVRVALTGALAADARAELAAREAALLAAHEEEWLAPLRPAIDGHTWWRGLLGVDTSVRKFLAHAEALACSRLVRFIDISDWSADLAPGEWQALTECPQLEWVTMLGIRGRYALDGDEALLGDDEAAALAASPHTARLFHLDLSFNAIGDRGVAALANAPGLTGLTELALRGCMVGDAGLVALAQGHLSRLEWIDLSYCDGRPSAAGWSAFIDAADWPNLRELWLFGNELTPELQTAARARWGSRVRLADDPG
ncbi:TIGR02996 domain-containing protein [Nannocystis punicea]|uniref:TIGR02996 domain-containing protein n=1 Tax=Nannocystis punicea TaxID=2995304 RepID=A0ABY7GS07_9BACT|nr:TIGR02996 domain-containing protein [Nannocystis poenicansa]WAS89708.1 TIGR02996 domain-containing protein [Nannocystis poenicansa]